MRLIIVVATALLSQSAFAGNRTVDRWDYERLSGFYEYEAQEKKFDVDRMLGVDDLKAQRKKDELEQQKALAEYKTQARKEERPRNDEDDPLYRAYVKEQAEVQKQIEKNRENYIVDRDQLQRSGKVAPVTEAQELKISDNRERVDWRYRALYGGSAGRPISPRGSVLSPPVRTPRPGGDYPADSGGGFVPPMTDDVVPSFEGAEPEIFDEDIPPPPPPEGFDEMIPPPPPPGLDETEF